MGGNHTKTAVKLIPILLKLSLGDETQATRLFALLLAAPVNVFSTVCGIEFHTLQL